MEVILRDESSGLVVGVVPCLAQRVGDTHQLHVHVVGMGVAGAVGTGGSGQRLEVRVLEGAGPTESVGVGQDVAFTVVCPRLGAAVHARSRGQIPLDRPGQPSGVSGRVGGLHDPPERVMQKAHDGAGRIDNLHRQPGGAEPDPGRVALCVCDAAEVVVVVVAVGGDRADRAGERRTASGIVVGVPPGGTTGVGDRLRKAQSSGIRRGDLLAVGPCDGDEVARAVVLEPGGAAEGVGLGQEAVVVIAFVVGGVAERVGLGGDLGPVVDQVGDGVPEGVGLGVGAQAGGGVGLAVGEVEAQGAVGAALVDDPVVRVVGVVVGAVVAVGPGQDPALRVVGETHRFAGGVVDGGEVAVGVAVAHQQHVAAVVGGVRQAQGGDAVGVDGDEELVAAGVGDAERDTVAVVGEGVVPAVAVPDGGEQRLVTVRGGGELLDQAGGRVGDRVTGVGAVEFVAGAGTGEHRVALIRVRVGLGDPVGPQVYDALLVDLQPLVEGAHPALAQPPARDVPGLEVPGELQGQRAG